MTFKEWMKAVDDEVTAIAGIGCDDLPDICYRLKYDDEMDPTGVAEELLRDEGFLTF